MREKKFLIPIEPIAWKRVAVNFNQKRLYSAQKNERLVTGIHFIAQMNNEEPFDGPLCCDMTFYMPIPVLLVNRREFHTSKPDTDNLVKYYWDCMSESNVITDDALFCELHAFKKYDKKPRVEITISEIESSND